MNIHEYQAKRLLARYGVPIPDGRIAYTAAEAAEAARAIGGTAWFVKPQRLGAPDRSVTYATTPEAAAAAAERVLSARAPGHGATRVLVEEALPETRALALVLSIDATAGRVACAVGSSLGANRPAPPGADAGRLLIDPALGVHPHHGRRLARRLGLAGGEAAAFGRCLTALYEAVVALDAYRIEIDPLLTHETRGVVAVGVAMAVDDAALYRQPEIQALRVEAEEGEAEREAERNGLNYLRLAGSIGCLANGAGLAMATMDSLGLHGGTAANFLDIGGGITPERIAAAFRLVLADPQVEGVLANVFGGIVRCEVIAEGILAAAREVGLHVPLVVRLEGTNAELGRKLLRQSGLPILSADTIDEAAAQVVAAVREAA